MKNRIERKIFLAPFTTLGIGGPTRYFTRVRREEDIPEICDWAHQSDFPILVLGGGSNMVVSDRGFSGVVLKMEIKGIQNKNETSAWVEVEAGAGEVWDCLVDYSVRKGWWGIENMSFIPGTVGAVAVQNVSAYGQESRMVISKVRAYDTQEKRFVELENDHCEFGFRKSIFNTTAAGRYIIVSVCFRLSKKRQPNLSRREIIEEIGRQGPSGQKVLLRRSITSYGQEEIRGAVIRLRTNGRLLPSPDTAKNAGTFFRASVISKNQLGPILKKAFNNIGLSLTLKIIGCKWKYPSNHGFKLPSRLLIEACGLENLQCGAIALYETNCAVLVNKGRASSATDILQLIHQVRTAVFQKTGVAVPIEPSLVGFTEEEMKQAFQLPSHPHDFA